MTWKQVGRAILYPHLAIMIALVPVSSALLAFSMIYVGTDTPIAYVSYVLAAYTLTVWCFKIPRLIELIRKFRNENKYAIRWRNDARLRVNVSLYASLVGNGAYAVFQLWLGLYHRAFWFLSLGLYYICLGVMRLFLVSHTHRYDLGENMQSELKKYRACGWFFLVMNLALSLIIFFMVYFGRSFEHHMITAIAMAAYTFTSFTLAILNVVKYKKYNSPAFSASKAISFASACVSMLTLTSTMLTTFSDAGLGEATKRLMLGGVGLAVVAVVLSMAIYMIVNGTRELKKQKDVVSNV